MRHDASQEPVMRLQPSDGNVPHLFMPFFNPLRIKKQPQVFNGGGGDPQNLDKELQEQ
jgi:hypothetical protein